MTAPVVAITATAKLMDGRPRVRLNEAYVDAIRAAGLVPLIVPPLSPEELSPVLDAVRGVVFSGGEDIDPVEYGATPSPHSETPHRARDRCELAMARMARARGLPTLAICRGIQLVNVALGGTLIQHIATECPDAVEHDRSEHRMMRVHEVRAEPGSLLADAIGETRLSVNSSHHQAIARPADGLRVTARSPDGIIEGAEWSDDSWWVLAVQWHPEELVADSASWDRGIFKAFAERVRP